MSRAHTSLIALLLLSSCAAPVPSAPASPSAAPSRTLSPTLPAIPSTPTAMPPQAAAPAPPACRDQGGTVAREILSDPRLPGGLTYRVYLPPCYAESAPAAYPVLYLLHGLGADDAQWDDLGVDEALDRLIAVDETPPFLVVMPWRRSGVDFEAVIVDVLAPHVDATYRTLPGPEGRAIGGISRGAGWAFRIGFRHPALFGAVGLHSPAVNEADRAFFPLWIRGIEPWALPRVWMDVGERDPLRGEFGPLADLFEEYEVSIEAYVDAGTHDAAYWSDHLVAYLRWYARPWAARGPQPGEPAQ